MPTAVVTGASQGFGLALTARLVDRGWAVVVDARDEARLHAAVGALPTQRVVVPVAGDVTEPAHQSELVAAAERLGGLDLLVHNASTLGVSPLPGLADYPLAELERVYAVNVLAPLAITQLALPLLRRGPVPTIVAITSDAGVEPYPGWGGYGSSKAALDQLFAVLAVEHPELRVYTFDPGDMRTAMHQQAFPGEDISDRPEPETVAPALLRLLDERPESGRYRAVDLSARPAA